MKTSLVYAVTKQPKFDDTMIRAVDQLVLAFINNPIRDDVEQQLDNVTVANEFRSLFLKLPRQSGKSVYIKQLARALGGSCLVVHPQMTMGLLHKTDKSIAEYPDNTIVTSINDVERFFYGTNLKPKWLLFDEVAELDAWDAIAPIIHRFPSPYLIGLYT